jgi:hypothetical protein
MSFARDARDTAASLYYVKALEGLREAHLEKSINGDEIPADYWEAGEDAALEWMKWEYFNLEVRRAFLPPERAESMTDEEDFGARSTELAEMAGYETHQILKGIPWVGHPEYEDDEESPG